MRVLLAGTFEPGFSRNVKLVRLLELAGHEVGTCHVELWADDRVSIPLSRKVQMTRRALSAYPRLIVKFLRARRPDVVVVAYPGWFDVVILAPLAKLRGIPVVFDPFISLFDTVVSDRRMVSPSGVVGRFCHLADRTALRLADRTLADTPRHADFFAAHADIEREAVGVVGLGANDLVFGPEPTIVPVPNRVLFHGTFIGLQGLETILRAAKELETEGVEFRIVGSGQEQAMVDRILAELSPTNVELLGLIPLEQVPREIAAATLCLGIFGSSAKAARVVPNKLYECLAVGRPVLTGDTPAISDAFPGGEVAVSPCGDPEALAAAIRHLLKDHEGREAMARRGTQRYREAFHETPLSVLLDEELRKAVGHDETEFIPTQPVRRTFRHQPPLSAASAGNDRA